MSEYIYTTKNSTFTENTGIDRCNAEMSIRYSLHSQRTIVRFMYLQQDNLTPLKDMGKLTILPLKS